VRSTRVYLWSLWFVFLFTSMWGQKGSNGSKLIKSLYNFQYTNVQIYFDVSYPFQIEWTALSNNI
jgi:hypothetical protein